MVRKITKKIATVLLWIIGVFIAIDLIVVALVFIPPIQNGIIQKVSSVLSENWNSEISVKKIYLTPTLKLVFEDFVIKDLHANDMIRVDEGKARLKSFGLKPVKLSFSNLEVSGADVTLRKYVGEESVNIGLWARQLRKKEKEKSGFLLQATKMDLTQSRFVFINESTVTYQGTGKSDMDYSYFELKDIDFLTTDFQVNGADISANILKLALNQYTGFQLKEASANFRINENCLIFNNGKIATPNSTIHLDLAFDYDAWSSYGSFVDSIRINAIVKPSHIDVNDIACFATALKGMDDQLVFAGNVNGPVNKMDIKNLLVRYGDNTSITGHLAVSSITNFKNADINLNLTSSHIDLNELATFKLPGGKDLNLPDMVKNIRSIQGSGYFNGRINKFNSHLAAISSIGNITVDLSTKPGAGSTECDANIITQHFDLGKLTKQNEILGLVNMNIKLDGEVLAPSGEQTFLDRFKANMTGLVTRFDLVGYPVNDIRLAGLIKGKKYNGSVISTDTNLNFNFNGLVDLTNQLPNFRSFISFKRFAPGEMIKNHAPIDSTTAQGLDKALLLFQKNPSLEFGFDSLELNITGNKLEGLNGFAGIDGFSLKDSSKYLKGDRFRLTLINTASGLHKLILTSSFLNASLTTNYVLKDLKDSLMNIGYRYFPNILPKQEFSYQHHSSDEDKNYYFRFYLETFQTRPLFDILLPGLRIAPMTTCDVLLNSQKQNDSINLNSRFISYKDVLRITNLSLQTGSVTDSSFLLTLKSDSITLFPKDNNFIFKDIDIKTLNKKNHIYYNLKWLNPASISQDYSRLSGYISAEKREDILIHFDHSFLNIGKDNWVFNEDHTIHLQEDKIDFRNVAIQSGKSSLKINGIFSFNKKDDLNIDIKNVDVSQINTFIKSRNLYFGGDISARVRMGSWHNERLITGKLLISDFVFNGEDFGNIFLTAAAPGGAAIGFGGGIFNRTEGLNTNIIENYNLKNYTEEQLKLANITGSYNIEKKEADIKANIDTLGIGFLMPFLQSFSNVVSGIASGELSFISTPDSTYFKGKVTVLDGEIGIAPLNTVYTLKNQVIEFSKEGFLFDNIVLTDYLGNIGYLKGSVFHRNFKDFDIDLNIETNKLLVLNTPKAPDTYFYGTGFVSGRVSIIGGTDKLTFRGLNLKTLQGSKVYLPMTFAETVSETEGVRFKVDSKEVERIRALRATQPTQSSMDMEFDFLFDITKDAEVQIDLDPSIGGTLTARVEGPLQLNLNSKSALNLLGEVAISSGKFAMALQDVFLNTRLDLVPGGTITFNGPVENSILSARALYKTSVPLNDIFPDDPRRTQVNAYLHLGGNLMQPNIGFSFEFPNLNADEGALVINTIDTTNSQNSARQFFSLLLFSKFNMEAIQIQNTELTNTGLEMISGIISNFMSQQFKYGDIGMTYRGASDSQLGEYSVNASIPFLNNRIIFETNLGYGYEKNPSSFNANNIIADVSMEFLLNEEGNWRIKVFGFSGDQSNINTTQDAVGGGGVGLIYKQDFNNGKDLVEFYRAKRKARQLLKQQKQSEKSNKNGK